MARALPKQPERPKLEWRREMRERTLNDYGPDEYIPAYIEHVPGPGQWYLDGEPISDERAAEIAERMRGA
jgi:hypothetical protein